MKTMLRSLVVCFLMVVVILLSSSQVHAQDLSKYRNFSFGMTVADISKQIDKKPSDATVVHERPALIEELTWLPIQPYDLSRPAEPVDQMLFSFYNGALYRMLMTYDSSATKGLTDEDYDTGRFHKVRSRNEACRGSPFPHEPIVQGHRKSDRTVGRFPIFA